jgi:hypothetical protein
MPSMIISLVMVFAIGLFAIALALEIGTPVIETAKGSSDFTDAYVSAKMLDNMIMESKSEGNGSIRRIPIAAPLETKILAGEDAILIYGGSYTQLFDFNTRSKSGNLVFVAGNDVSCEYKGSEMILLNRNVRFDLNWTKHNSTNLSEIDTSKNILRITDVQRNFTVSVVNSSVVINSDNSTSKGYGYSELLSEGSNLPFCSAHFYVNSSIQYDIYFRLFSGADFIEAEVRNIR